MALIRYAEVEISVDEILDLYTNPKELVAAPGAGKVLEFISLLLALDWSEGTAYTLGDATTLQVKFTDGDGDAASSLEAVTGFLDQESDQVRLLSLMRGAVVNEPLVLTLAGADVTDGDSPIHAKIAYRVHETGL
ncbi:unnamed protein product [marine sediment metagenome]|uniref:Uncharacterized protein n=1 Tax=marine sediment metagenome TaxID=412755 RepID=X1RDA1_9ZZZZ